MLNQEFIDDCSEMAKLHQICQENIYDPEKTVDHDVCARYRLLRDKHVGEMEEILKVLLPTGMVMVAIDLDGLTTEYENMSSVGLVCTEYDLNGLFILRPSDFIDGIDK